MDYQILRDWHPFKPFFPRWVAGGFRWRGLERRITRVYYKHTHRIVTEVRLSNAKVLQLASKYAK